MNEKVLHLGGGEYLAREQLVLIARPGSAPLKRLIRRYAEEAKVIDLTRGRRTRAVIFTAAGFIVLSPVRPETLAKRLLA